MTTSTIHPLKRSSFRQFFSRCPLDERGIDDALDEVAWLLWTWCVLERIYFHGGFSIAMLVYCRVLHVYILVHMNAYEII